MSIAQAAILGAVQGLTEFLPVSSSGHLIFFPAIFGWSDQGVVFDAVVHLGTLGAVAVVFWRDFFSLKRTAMFQILMSVIPVGAVGLFFGGWIGERARDPRVVAVSLIVWGVVLAVADWHSRRRVSRGARLKSAVEEASLADALSVGMAQAIALIPGTSRSGITITAGLFRGLDMTSALRFSFLLSIPTIALAGGASLLTAMRGGGPSAEIPSLLAGLAAAAASGFAAIKFLLRFLPSYGAAPFAVYRLAVGILILIIL